MQPGELLVLGGDDDPVAALHAGCGFVEHEFKPERAVQSHVDRAAATGGGHSRGVHAEGHGGAADEDQPGRRLGVKETLLVDGGREKILRARILPGIGPGDQGGDRELHREEPAASLKEGAHV